MRLYTFKHHFFSNVPRSTSDGRAWVLGAVFFFVFSLARLQQSDCCRGGGSLRFAPRTQHISHQRLCGDYVAARAHVAGLPHLTVLRRRPRAVPALSQFLRNTKPCARAREHKQKREETYAYLHVGTHATQGGTFTRRRRSRPLNLRRIDDIERIRDGLLYITLLFILYLSVHRVSSALVAARTR